MDPIRAVQILKPVNHAFQLDLKTLEQILGSNVIKDRYVEVLSIAGAFRKGKSFLLNFILKYLYAQYKKHDVSNWVNNEIDGFKSRGGRTPETTGIWIWSEIFTHDFETGEKVAIILMDTQGIFDSRSSTKENTIIFTISLLLSSIQCYNVMQNIQEDDLQNLELFTEYGRLAVQQNTGKPFEKLLFIVRDWPFADENPYGDGQTVIDELLTETEQQTSENHKLRKHLKLSFSQIGAFLLPYPGEVVATGKYNGNIHEIDAEFIKQLEILMPTICAPNKLILKKIRGQKVRAFELLAFLQTYVNAFNSETMPEPLSILAATEETSNILLNSECFNLYTSSMEKFRDERSLNENRPYFRPSELLELHQREKEKSLVEFRKRPKMGSEENTKSFETRLANNIEAQFKSYQQENNKKKTDFEEMVRIKIKEMRRECVNLYVESMRASLANVETFLSETDLQNAHATATNKAVIEFKSNLQPEWDDIFNETVLNTLDNDIQSNYLEFKRENEKKEQLIEDLRRKAEEAAEKARKEARAAELERSQRRAENMRKNLALNAACLSQYINSMNNTIGNSYQYNLQHIHNGKKYDAIAKLNREILDEGDGAMLRDRLENSIESNYNDFRYQNEQRRRRDEEAQERQRLWRQHQDMIAQLSNARQSYSSRSRCSIL